MNVLFMNLFWDAAGCSFLQHQAINKHTDWKARHFRGVKTFYPDLDIGPENYNADYMIDLIDHADVIEFCSAEHQRQGEAEGVIRQNHPKFSFGFDIAKHVKKKVCIYHDYNSFAGTWKERADDKAVWNRRRDIGYDAIFSSIPQAVNIYDGCVYIPDVVDEQSPAYTPNPNRKYNQVMLGHYPTGGGNNKNTQELMAALKQVPVDYDIPEKTLFHAEILNRKQKINLAFDALWRGFHGMTSVENMALGIPTMCRIDDNFIPAFEECFGTREVPFENVKDVADIVKCITFYKNHPEELVVSGAAVRRFAEKKWSFENIAKRIVGQYEKILGAK